MSYFVFWCAHSRDITGGRGWETAVTTACPETGKTSHVLSWRVKVITKNTHQVRSEAHVQPARAKIARRVLRLV